jgi:hypothetical protein
VYVALALNSDGEKRVLGLWIEQNAPSPALGVGASRGGTSPPARMRVGSSHLKGWGFGRVGQQDHRPLSRQEIAPCDFRVIAGEGRWQPRGAPIGRRC